MRSHAYLLIVLVSPALAQESPRDTPATTARSFDLHGESVKKILRETASSYFVTVRTSKPSAPESDNLAPVPYVPPDNLPPTAREAPRLPGPAPATSGPVSSLIEVLLGLEDDRPQPSHNKWLSCRFRGAMNPPTPGYEACGAVSRDPDSQFDFLELTTTP